MKSKSNIKRTCISWNDYFMKVADLSGERSKDPNRQVGACIVNEDNRIVGIGYNGMPNGCNDDKFSWTKGGKGLDNKNLYVCHAEVNAILNSNNTTRGCSLYSTKFPCNECAKVIIQSGIKKVFYKMIRKNRIKTKSSRRMLISSKVKIQKLK